MRRTIQRVEPGEELSDVSIACNTGPSPRMTGFICAIISSVVRGSFASRELPDLVLEVLDRLLPRVRV